ncbi:hypothetical protein X975_04608, partial [Stegodyphus mimosarum]
MRDNSPTCSWCSNSSNYDAWERLSTDSDQDPAALRHQHHHKMASDGSSSTDARPTRLPSEERRGAAYARAVEPDRGIPAHVGGEKQLHSATGYNLVIDSEGSIYGTREPY